MEIIGGMLIELVSQATGPICKCWTNHRGVVQYMKSLHEKLEELNGRKEDNELRMKAELVPGKKPKKEVELWLAKVEKINIEITSIEQRVVDMKFYQRAKLGKKLLKKIKEVDELYQKGAFLDDSLVVAVPQFGDLLPTARFGETTSKRKVEEIWACLTSDEVGKLGIFGMGGIGKTMTMKHINNRVLEEKEKFDSVIWVTASKASSIFNLQYAIACKLGLDISSYEDETTRAGKLHAALTIRKRYVLMLDDLWEVYRLEDVGIPEPTPENGCKLVLTTRLFEVCRRMSCKIIRMELLTNKEAWNLFSETVGRSVLLDPNLVEVALEFVKECGRLPLAIITIAGSLKGVVNYCEWKTSLEELKAYMKGGSTVLEQLKFSYTRLADDKLRDCLLYCSLYPEDARIYREELIEYLMDERIIEGIKCRQDGFEKGHAMLNKLENACLLESSVSEIGEKYVKMHDLVRDMLLQITSRDPMFLVEAGSGLRVIPCKEKWSEDLIRVSLTRNNILDISGETPRCPRLLTLMLNYNKLESIAECFFEGMVGLNVLDLSYTSIENLPESISNLVNLTALLLRRCHKLRYVPSLANLRALRRLDLSYTGINEVPQGMDMLVELRYLNLDTQSLEILPDGMLPKLSHLQCLLVCDKVARKLKVRGDELAQLRKLENFKGRLFDIDHFNAYGKCLDERRTSCYSLYLGFGMYCSDDIQYKKTVTLLPSEMSESVLPGDQYPVLLPRDVELLVVVEHVFARSLCTLALLNNAANLRSCVIRNSPSITSVLSHDSCTVPLLQNLENLYLADLQNLHWMIKEETCMSTTVLHPSTFSSLRVISIEFCPNLKNLFTPLMLSSSLQNLEEVHVKYCDQMSRIISDIFNQDNTEELGQIKVVEAKTNIIALPKLRVLELWGLPELKGICDSTESVVADSVQEVSIWNCPNLRNIPFLDQKPHPRSVRQIDAHEQWWESVVWQHPESKVALQAFCKFWAQ